MAYFRHANLSIVCPYSLLRLAMQRQSYLSPKDMTSMMHIRESGLTPILLPITSSEGQQVSLSSLLQYVPLQTGLVETAILQHMTRLLTKQKPWDGVSFQWTSPSSFDLRGSCITVLGLPSGTKPSGALSRMPLPKKWILSCERLSSEPNPSQQRTFLRVSTFDRNLHVKLSGNSLGLMVSWYPRLRHSPRWVSLSRTRSRRTRFWALIPIS